MPANHVRASAPSSLGLLEIQMLWGTDRAGRAAWPSAVSIGVAPEGTYVRLDGPDDVASNVSEIIERVGVDDDPAAAVAACRSVLRGVCPLTHVSSGPVYRIPDDLQPTASVDVRRSIEPVTPEIHNGNPGNWQPAEWEQLLSGELGPWAMALIDGRVASIAHTPRSLIDEAAEVGVWTASAYRGRGLAGSVTAAWAELLRPSGRHLYYSTSTENRSSQRVAAGLGLEEIGWVWNVCCLPNVVEFIRDDGIVRLLGEVLSWGNAEVQMRGTHVTLHRRCPGPVLARVYPESRSVVISTPGASDVRIDVGEHAVEALRRAYESAPGLIDS